MKMGMEDAMSGKPASLSQEQQAAVVAEIQARQKAAQEAALSASMETASQYLAENAKREGVKVTESGLQYEVITEGTGKTPTATDTVRVHYVGTTIDGKEFDSSVRRGEPAEFVLNQVIPGWTEGLQLMKEGAKYRFTLAPELAYGPGGTRGIPPNSVLIFEVELLEVKS
jgi:FKBP-type peptidyl-prolyl cis-trans isomerase FkpA